MFNVMMLLLIPCTLYRGIPDIVDCTVVLLVYVPSTSLINLRRVGGHGL